MTSTSVDPLLLTGEDFTLSAGAVAAIAASLGSAALAGLLLVPLRAAFKGRAVEPQIRPKVGYQIDYMGEWQVSHVPEDDVDSKMSTKLSSKECWVEVDGHSSASSTNDLRQAANPLKRPAQSVREWRRVETGLEVAEVEAEAAEAEATEAEMPGLPGQVARVARPAQLVRQHKVESQRAKLAVELEVEDLTEPQLEQVTPVPTRPASALTMRQRTGDRLSENSSASALKEDAAAPQSDLDCTQQKPHAWHLATPTAEAWPSQSPAMALAKFRSRALTQASMVSVPPFSNNVREKM